MQALRLFIFFDGDQNHRIVSYLRITLTSENAVVLETIKWTVHSQKSWVFNLSISQRSGNYACVPTFLIGRGRIRTYKSFDTSLWDLQLTISDTLLRIVVFGIEPKLTPPGEQLPDFSAPRKRTYRLGVSNRHLKKYIRVVFLLQTLQLERAKG